MSSRSIPAELEPVRLHVQAILNDVKSVKPEHCPILWGARTEAGRKLPVYYLVYFVLADLLGYENLGRSEKVAWSIPVEFKGRLFMIEHRKMGVGVFALDSEVDESLAGDLVSLVNQAVVAAQPFFEWLALQAVQDSSVNILNKSEHLYRRYGYFLNAYQNKKAEIEAADLHGGQAFLSANLEMRLSVLREARWLGHAAVESFFGWTEHVFIHIGILKGNLRTAREISDIAKANWAEKFKVALNISDPLTKKYFDQMVIIRREVRNFMAHGAFGKEGQAFQFHSAAGAVPVMLPHKANSSKFSIRTDLSFSDDQALSLIKDFIVHLWSAERAPAKIYVESELPTILTYVADGTYFEAMKSVEAMAALVKEITYRSDVAADMDW